MNPSLKWVLVAALALAAAWGGVEFGRWSHAPETTPGPTSNNAIFELMATPLTTLDGKTKTLNDWKGKVLVVNFWATWCPPCREEMPEFSLLQDKYGPDGVQFVGIAIDDAANVAQFKLKTPVTYPLLIGAPNSPELMVKLGDQQQGLPFTVIVGRDGKLMSSNLGRVSAEDLARHLPPRH